MDKKILVHGMGSKFGKSGGMMIAAALAALNDIVVIANEPSPEILKNVPDPIPVFSFPNSEDGYSKAKQKAGIPINQIHVPIFHKGPNRAQRRKKARGK